MGIGLSGLVSNMDTDTIVKAMVSRYTERKTNYTKQQTKLEWKQDTWKQLNTKIYNLYSKTLSDLRFTEAYTKKKTAVSDPTIASITASGNSVNGTQSLAVKQLAKPGYLTGGKITTSGGGKVSGSTKMSDLGITEDTALNVSIGGSNTTVNITKDMTVDNFVSELQKTGVNASFDSTNQRIFVSSKDSGADNDFSLTAADGKGIDALKSLGLYTGPSAADVSVYQMWADYGQSDIDSLISGMFEAQKTTADKEKALLESEIASWTKANETLASQNEALQKQMELNGYAKEYAELYQGTDWDSTEKQEARARAYSDTVDAIAALKEAKASGETIDEDELASLELKQSAIEQVDAAIGSATLVSDDRATYLTKIEEAITADDATFTQNEETIEANQAAITENAAIIAGDSVNTSLDDIVAEKNAATLASITDEITSKWETAKAYMAQYNYLNGNTEVTQADYEEAVAKIGDISYSSSGSGSGATRIEGQNAVIELNGAEFESSSNTITVNGLTITAQSISEKNVDGSYKKTSITTSDDVDAIYDTIKKFFTEYNALIKEMDSLYNASSSKGYEPLTSEEKEAMSDSDIEKWESKIKDSLLRRDGTLDSISTAMKSAMSKGVEVNGKTCYLSTFGISTLGYFLSGENEKNMFHIAGDPDDSSTSGETDKLRAAIIADPDAVTQFFTGLTSNLYDALSEKMKSTEMSSAYTVYDDKQMKEDYNNYTKKISAAEETIKHWEDYYYRKFTAMETALSKLNSQTSALSSLLGSS